MPPPRPVMHVHAPGLICVPPGCTTDSAGTLAPEKPFLDLQPEEPLWSLRRLSVSVNLTTLEYFIQMKSFCICPLATG